MVFLSLDARKKSAIKPFPRFQCHERGNPAFYGSHGFSVTRASWKMTSGIFQWIIESEEATQQALMKPL
jgi:hypothetical protein